ncbi:MAG TPA: glutaredoxin family protein [Aggregatilineales bacterium]|nr:glutaredoxin family protein [Aggregatilineales bacterium]
MSANTIPDDFPYDLVMYARTTPCPFVNLAHRVLEAQQVPFREVYIDLDKSMEERVLKWTGFLSVPTLVVARKGDDLPYAEPGYLEKDASPRGIDRGSMITEPSEEQLVAWLQHHGFLKELDSSAA